MNQDWGVKREVFDDVMWRDVMWLYEIILLLLLLCWWYLSMSDHNCAGTKLDTVDSRYKEHS